MLLYNMYYCKWTVMCDCLVIEIKWIIWMLTMLKSIWLWTIFCREKWNSRRAMLPLATFGDTPPGPWKFWKIRQDIGTIYVNNRLAFLRLLNLYKHQQLSLASIGKPVIGNGRTHELKLNLVSNHDPPSLLSSSSYLLELWIHLIMIKIFSFCLDTKLSFSVTKQKRNCM